MSRAEIAQELGRIDTNIEICKRTLSMLAENVEEDTSWILIGIMEHLESTEGIIDQMEEKICEKAVTA